MTTDTVLTLLNVVWGLMLTGIGIEMVNSPPGNDPKKKWGYRILFCVLGGAVVATTLLQSSRTATEQTAERKQHDNEQGKLEGKLDLMSDVLKKSSCPSTADIGAAVQEGLAKQKYQKARASIIQGKLADLSSDLLVTMASSVTQYLRNFGMEWQSADHQLELASWSDHEHEEWNENPNRIQKLAVSKPQREWKEDLRRTNEKYHAQLLQLLSDADALRVALRNKLPKEAQTPEDDAEAVSFAQLAAVASGGNIPPIENAADYLDSLAKRVSRIKTLKN